MGEGHISYGDAIWVVDVVPVRSCDGCRWMLGSCVHHSWAKGLPVSGLGIHVRPIFIACGGAISSGCLPNETLPSTHLMTMSSRACPSTLTLYLFPRPPHNPPSRAIPQPPTATAPGWA